MVNNLYEIWENMLDIIKGELSQISFSTWLSQIEPVTITNDVLILRVPNEFLKGILEARYYPLFFNVLKYITSKEMEVKFILPNEDINNILENLSKQNSKINEDILPTNLNPKYTFDTFVVGNSNRFAHAAALAVAEAPAKAYNPLFIYGGVGLGKTHLMHAIGHFILSHRPRTRVVYVSSEKFTNELINSIRDDKNDEFRNKYRSVDVLLIDDIQFIAGKERTQEEFFHTFNALYEANKQIIISSDRPPKEIPTLEDRLRSRFEWGLITDIQPPDLETRIAILRKKAILENLSVPNEVLVFIADNIQSNIRELEGALIRIVAYSSLNNKEITLELANEVLKDILPSSRPRQITIQLIQEITAKHFGIRPEEFKSKKRFRDVAYPRQIAMYLARELTDLSLPKIGEEFGGRDHTTVIHAYEKISELIQKDISVKNLVNKLIQEIKGN